jgi:type IV secretory pathway component VirB8
MSKSRNKAKTQHQNYYYHVVLRDTYEWDSEPETVSPVFSTEQEANEFARLYSKENSIKDGFNSLTVERAGLKT